MFISLDNRNFCYTPTRILTQLLTAQSHLCRTSYFFHKNIFFPLRNFRKIFDFFKSQWFFTHETPWQRRHDRARGKISWNWIGEEACTHRAEVFRRKFSNIPVDSFSAIAMCSCGIRVLCISPSRWMQLGKW